MDLNGSQNNIIKNEDIILYKRRWVILLLFILFSLTNIIQYFHFTVIANVVVQYYGVSYTAINWSAMVKSVMFPILCIPGNYLIERIGIRSSVLVGIVGTCIGTCIKFASIHPDRFWVAILAQGIIFIFHICIMPLLPKITTAWFGIKETATANAIGSAGFLFGVGLSFLLPPMIVTKGEPEDIAKRLTLLNTIYAAFSLTMAIALFCFFSNAPPTPPSIAQMKSIKNKETSEPFGFIRTCKHFKLLLSNSSYVIFMIIYSVNSRMISPIHTMLNEIVLYYYPDATRDVGIIGLLLYFLGIIGSLGVGIILDKYKKFKKIIYSTYTIYFLSLALFTGLLDKGIPFFYTSAIILGIADASLLTSAIEVCIELTYPAPENIATSLIVITNNIISIIIISIYSYIFEAIGVLWANMTLLLIVFITNFLFYFVNFNLKRQSAQNFIDETEPLIRSVA